MRIAHLFLAGGVLGFMLAGSAPGQAIMEGLRQPNSFEQMGFGGDTYVSFAPADPNGPSESPSNAPASPSGTADLPSPKPETAASAPQEAASSPVADADEPWTLPQPCFLQNRGITLGGWTEVGTTFNNHKSPGDYNGVVTFPDRAEQFLLDQQWLFLDKPIKNDGYGWDWGGHIDVVYGSDAFFTQAVGLETEWKQEDYYQLALPQFYLDVAYNDLTVRMGHFYTILGYEVVQAPQNFFYTHAYTFQYGEPFTHTGMLFMYKVNDNFSFSAGFHRGNDIFEPQLPGTDHLGFLGGVKWTGPNKKLEVAFSVSTSVLGEENRTDIYSLVATYHLTEKFRYIFQHDLGYSNNTGLGGTHTYWYGLNQYFLYDINKCWSAGLRAEWFRDEDGTRVTGLRPGDPDLDGYPGNPVFGASFPGSFYEVSLGLNWKPRSNLLIRPEIRWDWYDASGDVTTLPFDGGDRASQFMIGSDFILTY